MYVVSKRHLILCWAHCVRCLRESWGKVSIPNLTVYRAQFPVEPRVTTMRLKERVLGVLNLRSICSFWYCFPGCLPPGSFWHPSGPKSFHPPHSYLDVHLLLPNWQPGRNLINSSLSEHCLSSVWTHNFKLTWKEEICWELLRVR